MDSHFEPLRQEQETRNEITINFIQMVHFGVVLFANVMTHFLPVAPYRASVPVLALLAGSLLARIGFWGYLRRDPPYHAGRRYVVSVFDLLVFTAAPLLLGLQNAYPALFLQVFAVCIYAVLIAQSGLRYCVRLVVLTGAATFLLHAAVFAIPSAPDYRLPLLCVGGVVLGSITACTASGVATLMRIHREAAVKDQLARFLPTELVTQMARQPDLLTRKTERRVATVIFTDVRGFTSLSEKLPPEKVVEFLNQFLEEMTAAIMNHQGMLDKFIGDAVMGVFGVPLPTEDHAVRALRAALDMQRRLQLLNERLRQQGLADLTVGIGIHTGDLLFGAIGSSRRLDYTVIGDTVNVSSRIEGMTRSYPVEILVSEATRRAIGDEIPLHFIATVQVKNRDEPLRLWSPDPVREGVEPLTPQVTEQV